MLPSAPSSSERKTSQVPSRDNSASQAPKVCRRMSSGRALWSTRRLKIAGSLVPPAVPAVETNASDRPSAVQDARQLRVPSWVTFCLVPSDRRIQRSVVASLMLTAMAKPSGESDGYSKRPRHAGSTSSVFPSRDTHTSSDSARLSTSSGVQGAPRRRHREPCGLDPVDHRDRAGGQPEAVEVESGLVEATGTIGIEEMPAGGVPGADRVGYQQSCRVRAEAVGVHARPDGTVAGTAGVQDAATAGERRKGYERGAPVGIPLYDAAGSAISRDSPHVIELVVIDDGAVIEPGRGVVDRVAVGGQGDRASPASRDLPQPAIGGDVADPDAIG